MERGSEELEFSQMLEVKWCNPIGVGILIRPEIHEGEEIEDLIRAVDLENGLIITNTSTMVPFERIEFLE
jgi:hypothetical protein